MYIDYGNSNQTLNSLARNLREFCMQHPSAMVICCRESFHARHDNNITGYYRRLGKGVFVLKEIVTANGSQMVFFLQGSMR